MIDEKFSDMIDADGIWKKDELDKNIEKLILLHNLNKDEPRSMAWEKQKEEIKRYYTGGKDSYMGGIYDFPTIKKEGER